MCHSRHFEVLFEHMDLFTISGGMEAISKHIGVKREQLLFLFLHIDEFQMIDKWAQDTEKATFFKDTLRHLASFMHSPATLIQTFLSGTAPQAVVKVQEPTTVSFRFIDCPLLSFRSMLDIAEHYADEKGAEESDCGASKWMLCRQFLQLLEDTGGLPRALQYLFGQCFGVASKGTFFRNITTHDFITIHAGTKHELNGRYKIRAIDENRQLALRLLHHCISEILIQHAYPSQNFQPHFCVTYQGP